MNRVAIVAFLALMAFACASPQNDSSILPEVPEGAQAVSVTGEPLFAPEPPESYLARFQQAKEMWEADSSNADNLIWYGRWAAYCGDYRESIRIFSEGIRLFPTDARMLRHRGHRYITIRDFNRAVDDFNRVAVMIAGTPDEIEPDGMPNALNIPVSTLHSNIYYHLGLARYLSGDVEGALEAWDSDMALAVNDDMTVATMHWIFMALMDLGRTEEALARLETITEDMHVIENEAYHLLCLYYKGERSLVEMAGEDFSEVMGDAMLFGLGNWHLHRQGRDSAMVYFERMMDGGSWASFGYIAAEMKMMGW